MKRSMKRGDVYYVNLDPVVGSEQGGGRPVLIISNDIGNKHSPTVIVAAITSRSNSKARIPTHVPISDFAGFERNSIVLLEQIRTIDKKRLQEYFGTFDKSYLSSVDQALAISIGLKILKDWE